MKTENEKRKLHLSKETLLQLNEMDKIYGGEETHSTICGVQTTSCSYQDSICGGPYQGIECQVIPQLICTPNCTITVSDCNCIFLFCLPDNCYP
jgi:hypothetical protein